MKWFAVLKEEDFLYRIDLGNHFSSLGEARKHAENLIRKEAKKAVKLLGIYSTPVTIKKEKIPKGGGS